MKTKPIFSNLGKLLLVLIAVYALLTSFSKRDAPNKYPEDMSMSEFVMGKWKIISVFDAGDGKAIKEEFPGFNFVNDTTVIYSDFNAIYKFIEPDTITVNNVRVIGIDIWHLEREDNNLVIYASGNRGTTKYVLERCSSWFGYVC